MLDAFLSTAAHGAGARLQRGSEGVCLHATGTAEHTQGCWMLLMKGQLKEVNSCIKAVIGNACYVCAG